MRDSSDLAIDAPTILLSASGERFADALARYLVQHGTHVEVTTADDTAQAAFVAAPDLIVLAGDSAKDGGAALLAILNENPMTSTLPVVLISDGHTSRPVSGFRHGVVAVIERSASADEMARRIAEVAHDLPERTGDAAGRLAIDSAEMLVEILAESLRSGVLSLRNDAGEGAQIVIKGDRPIDEMVDELVRRIRPLAQRRGSLRYEFQENSAARISAISLDNDNEGSLDHLRGRRLLIIEQNPARSDLLAQDLRAAGAIVVVMGATGSNLDLARELRPEVVIIDGSGVESWAANAFQAIRKDPYLRWASLLLVEAQRLWRNPKRPDTALLAHSVHELVAPDLALTARAQSHAQLDTRLETLGPVRMLRALLASGQGLRVRVHHRRVVVELDLIDGLLAGARANVPLEKKSVEGLAALQSIIGLTSARVRVEHVTAPRSATIMAPLDDAISHAQSEIPIVAPSIPPPGEKTDVDTPPLPPPPALPSEGRANEVDELVAQLEGVLTKLRRVGASIAPPAAPDPVSLLPLHSEDDVDQTTGLHEPKLVQRLQARMDITRRAAVPPPKSLKPIPLPGSEPIPPRKREPFKASLPPPKASLPPKRRGDATAPAIEIGERRRTPSVAPAQGMPGVPRRRPRKNPTLMMGSGSGAPHPLESETTKPAITAASVASESVSLPAGHSDAPPIGDYEKPTQPGERTDVSDSVTQELTTADLPAIGRPPALPRRPIAPPVLQPSQVPALDEDERDRGEEADTVVGPAEAHARAAEEAEARARAITLDPVEAFEGDTTNPLPHPAAAPAPHTAAPHTAAPHPEPSAGPPLDASLGEEPAQTVSQPARIPLKWIVIAATGGLGLLMLVVGIGIWAASSDDTSEPMPTHAVAPPEEDGDSTRSPSSEPQTANVAPEPQPVPTPTDAHAAETPSDAPAQAGPASSDPSALLGSDADLDLASFGVEPVRAPGSVGQRRRMFRRLIAAANRARRQHNLDEAEARYQRLLGMDPEYARALAGLARVHMDRGNHDRALLLAQRLCRLRQQYPANFVFLGDVYRELGNTANARTAYLHALELHPNNRGAQRRIEALDR